MAEYIEREAIKTIIREQESKHGLRGMAWIEMAIDRYPVADVTKVIFCKYCKHYHAVISDEKTGEVGDLGICDQPWRNEGYDVNETDYCSSAEPK